MLAQVEETGDEGHAYGASHYERLVHVREHFPISESGHRHLRFRALPGARRTLAIVDCHEGSCLAQANGLMPGTLSWMAQITGRAVMYSVIMSMLPKARLVGWWGTGMVPRWLAWASMTQTPPPPVQ